MTPTALDHLCVAFFAFGVPWLAVRAHRSLQRSLARDPSRARRVQYRRTIAGELLAAISVVLLWIVSDRPIEGLGLRMEAPTAWWAWTGWTLAGVGIVLLIAQAIAIRSEEQLAQVRPQLESVKDLLPRTRAEMQWFVGLSLAAGTCEELVYRGYVMAYFSAWGGSAVALVASSVLFGFAHTYQGAKGGVKTAVLGFIAGGLYLSTGSLLAPMALHTVLDISSGTIARRALST